MICFLQVPCAKYTGPGNKSESAIFLCSARNLERDETVFGHILLKHLDGLTVILMKESFMATNMTSCLSFLPYRTLTSMRALQELKLP